MKQKIVVKKVMRFAVVFISILLGLSAQASSWSATWVSSQQKKKMPTVEGVTLREIVHVSLGGPRIRLHLSNVFGDGPLVIGGVHAALQKTNEAIVPESDRMVTFSGAQTLVIPVGQEAVSDAIELETATSANLAISIYLPSPTPLVTTHVVAAQTSYISKRGAYLSEEFVQDSANTNWFFLSEIDAETDSRVIMAFGDSLTDGVGSTVNANHRWPNFLFKRLMDQGVDNTAVVDAGIAFNRILNDQYDGNQPSVSAEKRFDRDALSVEGVGYLILFEGINDLGLSGKDWVSKEVLTADELIEGYKKLIGPARAKGIQVIGATLTPNNGSGYYTEQKEKVRLAVNEWIRTPGNFDGFVDFDQAVRDPEHPEKLQAAFDAGDHLHMSDAGYQAIANSIDLSLFQQAPQN